MMDDNPKMDSIAITENRILSLSLALARDLSLSLALGLCMCVCMYICIYAYIYILVLLPYLTIGVKPRQAEIAEYLDAISLLECWVPIWRWS